MGSPENDTFLDRRSLPGQLGSVPATTRSGQSSHSASGLSSATAWPPVFALDADARARPLGTTSRWTAPVIAAWTACPRSTAPAMGRPSKPTATRRQPVSPAETGTHERRPGAASRQRTETQSADYVSDLGELRRRRKQTIAALNARAISMNILPNEPWISNESRYR